MSAEGNAVPSDESAGNDLSEAIDGLGAKTAKALRKLGIGSSAELVQYLTQHTAKELSQRLAEQGVQIGAKKIENEDWLGQARRQAAQVDTEPAKLKPEAREAAEGERPPGSPGEPRSEVRFGVTFRREENQWQVTTYDERLNGPEMVWGTESAEWANWILRRMGLAAPEADARAQLGVSIEILDVQAFVAEQFKKMAVQVHFVLSGAQSEREALAAARTPFWIHVHIIEDRGAMNHIASQPGTLEPGQFEYSLVLEFQIPEVGRYTLLSLVVLLPTVSVAVHQGPTFRVTSSKEPLGPLE